MAIAPQIQLNLTALPAGNVHIGGIGIGAGNPQDRVSSVSQIISGIEVVFTIFRDINHMERGDELEMTRAEFIQMITPIEQMIPRITPAINLRTCGALQFVPDPNGPTLSYEANPPRQGRRGGQPPVLTPLAIPADYQQPLRDLSNRITAITTTVGQRGQPGERAIWVPHNRPQNQNIPIAQPNNPPPQPNQWIPGQPTGLARGNNNCWINAMMHAFVLQNDEIRNWIMADTGADLAPMRTFIQQYEDDQRHQRISTADASSLRLLLAPGTQPNTQQDANAGLMFLMNHLPQNSPLRKTLITRNYYRIPDRVPAPQDYFIANHLPPQMGQCAYVDAAPESNWGNINLDDLQQGNNPVDLGTLTNSYLETNYDLVNPTFRTITGSDNHQHQYPLAKQKRNYDNPPPLLLINIKRFAQDGTKIDTPVNVPMELDLTGANQMVNRNAVYDLHSVIVHNGTRDNGHYISYVKKNGNWFKCDDDRITPTQQNELLSEGQQVYNCVYKQRDQQPQPQPQPVPQQPAAANPNPINNIPPVSTGLKAWMDPRTYRTPAQWWRDFKSNF